MFKFGVSALFALIAASKDSDEFSSDEYLALTRQEKSDKIWAKIIENTNSGSWHLGQALIVN